MKELTQWWEEINGSSGTWLILGKGPTLQRIHEFDLSCYRSLSLNHAVQELHVEVASVIDMDVITDCGEAIDRNAKFLLMPRYPHVNMDKSKRPLESYFDEFPVLRKLSDEGRLVWYNLASGRPEPSSPRIPLGWFSAEVVVNLLSTMRVRSIRTLGVDGGTAYSSKFDEKTRLANKHASFDIQWPGIAAMVRQNGIDYAPLTSETPIRVYIGTDPSQMLAARVLQYSIIKHCPAPVVFDTMDTVEVPAPKDPQNESRTQFSFKRFSIPRLAEFKGKAIYLDADMLVFRNLLDLWDIPFKGARILHAPSSDPQRPKQFSVLLLNCAELKWDLAEIIHGLDEGNYDYDALMKEFCIVPPEFIRANIPPEWNSLEEYVPGRTALIHYTDSLTQPWVSHKNRNGHIWVEHLLEAVRTGFISLEEIEDAIKRGFVRPSLALQLKVDKRLWSLLDTLITPLLDVGFKPHHKLETRLKRKSTSRHISGVGR